MKIKLLCAVCTLWAATFGAASAAETVSERRADFAGEPASADARYAANWVSGNDDNQKLPFVIVDKKTARLFVFGPDARLRGSTPVLLGAGVGDHSVADIASRDLGSLRVEERTTPAGRFASEPGHNLKGEDIVWVDYAAKIAIHRLRPAPAHERRAQRLASAVSEDSRISLGCIVVPVNFYDNVVRPVLGKSYGVVYVLPETRSARAMFGSFEVGLNSP